MYVDDDKCAKCGKKLIPDPYLDSYNSASAPYFCSAECAESIKKIDEDDLLPRDFDVSKFYSQHEGVDGLYNAFEIARKVHNEEERKRIEQVERQGERTKEQFIREYNGKKERVERDRQEKRYEEIVVGVKAELAYLAEFGHDILTHEEETPFDADGFQQYVRSLTVEQNPTDAIAWTALINASAKPKDTIAEIYTRFPIKENRARVRKHFGMPLDKPIIIQEEVKAIQKLAMSHDDLVKFLFRDGPISQALLRQVPIAVPPRIWFEHCFILAPSGTGKTTLIEELILRHLNKPDPPALVVVDPKGEMVKRLKALELFSPEKGKGRLYQRLVVLDANAPSPPALNLFAAAPAHLPLQIRERIENQTIAMLEYIFSSSDFKLTQKQSVGFAFLARLMFKIPGANLDTLFDVVEEMVHKGGVSQYQPYIEQLDGTAQRFFRRDFWDEFKETKSQIKGRVYLILGSPAAQRILNARQCSVDWYSCLQKNQIILVNTGFNQDPAGSQVLGRYVIASVYAAARARELLPESEWNPAFMFVDEAQLVVDERTFPQEILSFVREYRLGVTLSTQQMTGVDFNDNIRNSISTNTSMKFAASVEGDDLRFAARDLRAEPEFVQNHAVTDTTVNFACFVRNIPHKQPFTVSVSRGRIKQEPTMSLKYQAFSDRTMADLYGEKIGKPIPAQPVQPHEEQQPKIDPPSPDVTKKRPDDPKQESDDPDYF